MYISQRKSIYTLCLVFVSILFTFHFFLKPAMAFTATFQWCCPDEGTDNKEDILEIQQVLHKIGLYQGSPDGIYGSLTQEAVKQFQRSNKLSGTGLIDGPTRRALEKYFEMPVTGDSNRPKGKVRLEIRIETRTLTVYDDEKPFKTYKVGVGKHETPTPIGEWEVTRKARNWGTGFGTRWMGLSVPWGIYGIHGTNKPWSIGSRASHGCIRMFNKDVEELYEWVEPGTKVTIIGRVYPVRYEDRLILRRGYKGSDVYHVQLKLKEKGYLEGKADGIYGPATIAAVKAFQKDHGFPETGELDIDVYPALGL